MKQFRIEAKTHTYLKIGAAVLAGLLVARVFFANEIGLSAGPTKAEMEAAKKQAVQQFSALKSTTVKSIPEVQQLPPPPTPPEEASSLVAEEPQDKTPALVEPSSQVAAPAPEASPVAANVEDPSVPPDPPAVSSTVEAAPPQAPSAPPPRRVASIPKELVSLIHSPDKQLSELDWQHIAESIDESEYSVAPGDSLSMIANRFYGDVHLWTKLWALNPEIENPHNLKVGFKIRLK